MRDFVKGPADQSVPLHKFTEGLTTAWLYGGDIRKALVNRLLKDYPSGVGVVTATMCLIAYVAPNGSVRELSPPFRRYHRWEMTNQPSHSECECGNWLDPESGECWKKHHAGHHPVCCWRKGCNYIFDKYNNEAIRNKNIRPDMLGKISAEVT